MKYTGRMAAKVTAMIVLITMLITVIMAGPAIAEETGAEGNSLGSIMDAIQNILEEAASEDPDGANIAAPDEADSEAPQETESEAPNEAESVAPEKTEAPATEVTSRTEGAGFGTPEEAMESYIAGLVDLDMNEMLAACAIETFAEKYDIEKQIERIQAMMPPTQSSSYIPNNGELALAINIETRRAQMTQMIKLQYLMLTGSKTVSNENMGMTIPLSSYDSAEDMVADLFAAEDPVITYNGEMVPVFFIENRYYSLVNQNVLAKTAYADNAERLVSVAAIIYVNDRPVLLTLGAECFDGRWYITSNNNLANMLGLSASSGGLVDLEEFLAGDLEEFRGMYDQFMADEEIMTVLGKLDAALGSVDVNEIYSLPEDQAKEVFAAACEEALMENLTSEEMAVIGLEF